MFGTTVPLAPGNAKLSEMRLFMSAVLVKAIGTDTRILITAVALPFALLAVIV